MHTLAHMQTHMYTVYTVAIVKDKFCKTETIKAHMQHMQHMQIELACLIYSTFIEFFSDLVCKAWYNINIIKSLMNP